MRTVSVKPSEIQCRWYVVDANDKVLGRLATEIARRLRGKHRPEYTPHMDLGDHIVVINAEKIKVTGNKANQKMYHRHSEYPGGLKSIVFKKLIGYKPERIIESAVRGMLPRGPLGRELFRKLHVYKGDVHKHEAQQPELLDI